MELSEIEKDILEKASAPGGTNYRKHDWISKADFIEIAERLVAKGLLYRKCQIIDGDFNINIYNKKNR